MTRLHRLLPPVTLFAGLFLFALTMFVLGLEAAGEKPTPFHASSQTTANGTAVLAYPTKHFGLGSTRLQVSYSFPSAPGDAYFVDCEDLAAMRRGELPTEPMLAFTQLQEGNFVVSEQTVPALGPFLTNQRESGSWRVCEPAVAFMWTTQGGDPTTNQPTASIDLHFQAFDGERYWLLLTLMTTGAILALLGGLGWARTRAGDVRLPGANDSPIEMLRASLDRLGEQLQRTRRYLLLSGVLGVVLWYPVLIPWTWSQAKTSSNNPLFPVAVSGLTFLFLLVLTALWIWELHRLDRELQAWRGRMGELRLRETNLMETL